jgi:hypothetical protein
MVVDLDPVVPVILALAPRPLPRLLVERVDPGVGQGIGQGTGYGVRLGLAGPSPAAVHVLHLELLDAAGAGTGAAPPDRRWVVRLPAGETRDWTPPSGVAGQMLRVTDMLGGAVATVALPQ